MMSPAPPFARARWYATNSSVGSPCRPRSVSCPVDRIRFRMETPLIEKGLNKYLSGFMLPRQGDDLLRDRERCGKSRRFYSVERDHLRPAVILGTVHQEIA